MTRSLAKLLLLLALCGPGPITRADDPTAGSTPNDTSPASDPSAEPRPTLAQTVELLKGLVAGQAIAPAAAPDLEPLPGSQPEISISGQGRVQLHVADVPLSTVLQLLSVESQKNIVASPGVKGKVTANLYDVTFDEAMDAVLTPNDAGFVTRGNFVYVHTRAELEAMKPRAQPKPETRVFRLNYLTAVDAMTYLAPMLDKRGTIVASPEPSIGVAGGGAGGTDGPAWAERDVLVVSAPPDVLAEVESVIRQLDVRPRQVLVEATILRANLTDDNALGIDFAVVGGVDLELLGGTSQAVQNLTLGQLPTDRFEKFNSNVSTDFVKDVPAGGITVGIIKDHVALFLRALEQYTDTTVLANPKVLALNKQKAQVIVGRRDGYLTTTVTETQAVQTVEFLETGTQLVFRPYIADDGWVRVELHPEDSVGFVNAQGLPTEQTTEVTTNVMVRDNETILIGGLFREVTTDARNQVPGLGDIPLLGQLFRSNNDSSAREEVIILLTLHVVKDHDRFAAESEMQREHIERMRAGLRRGLMWHGRDRLAQSFYHMGVDALDDGRPRTALWYLDLSLSNNARFLPAIQLKEKIRGERAWDLDGTAVRSFLHRLIARERGEPLSMFGRPEITAWEPGDAAAPAETQPADDLEGVR